MNSNPHIVENESIPSLITDKIFNYWMNNGIVFVSHDIPVKRKFCVTGHNIQHVAVLDDLEVPLGFSLEYWRRENYHRIYCFVNKDKIDYMLFPIDYFSGLRFFYSGAALNITSLRMSFNLCMEINSLIPRWVLQVDFCHNFKEKISLKCFFNRVNILYYTIELYGKKLLFHDLSQLFFEKTTLDFGGKSPIICRWDGAK